MAIPEQIRKQSEAVQELYKQMNPESDAEKGEGEGAPAGDSDASQADGNTAAESAAPAPAGEQKPGAEKVAEETLVQKYKTLQGMYNAEVPRLHQQTREQAQRLQQLEQLLAAVSAQQQQQKPAEQAPARLVSQQEVEEYGDSLEVMRKVSREEIGPVMQRLAAIEGYLQQMQNNLVPQVQQVVQRQVQSAEQVFWSELARAVPNWREVNDNPDFQSWLLEADPLTGITRQTYLEDAQRSLEAHRVANFFRTWLEKSGQAPVAQSSGTSRSTAQSKSELERQVAPGKAKSTGNPQSSKGTTYTPDDITKFFREVREGKYKGREDERNRIERDIFAAQREGRIQLNA